MPGKKIDTIPFAEEVILLEEETDSTMIDGTCAGNSFVKVKSAENPE